MPKPAKRSIHYSVVFHGLRVNVDAYLSHLAMDIIAFAEFTFLQAPSYDDAMVDALMRMKKQFPSLRREQNFFKPELEYAAP